MKTGEKKIIRIRRGIVNIAFVMCGRRVIFGDKTKFAKYTLLDLDGKYLLDSDGNNLICP